MDNNISILQSTRYTYQPKVPAMLRAGIGNIQAVEGNASTGSADSRIKELFPKTYGMKEVSFKEGKSTASGKKQVVGVILSGGQAPGGHNVIAGLYDAIHEAGKDNVLLGFKGGPSGLTDDNYITLTGDIIDQYRNTGGFDMIGSGRTKLETEEQFKKVAAVAEKHGMTAIVIIGGDDSNTNAAVLAEYFADHDVPVQVIGCPKTIDGDLKNDEIEASFGFDTATKTYSELIGNIMRDANSAKKYWHFIKLMGRSASHIALECALQTHPNVCLISEEVEKNGTSLESVADSIVDSVVHRAAMGMNFGVVVVPEGLIEFIPEMKKLIAELNDTLAAKGEQFAELESWEEKTGFLSAELSEESMNVFSILPVDIQQQLLMDRDPHGNVQVSRIETEKLLATLTETKLKALKAEGKYTGKFSSMTHFFGYEGRAAFPSNFDADYCYSLGYTAFLLIQNGYTGYMSTIRALDQGVDAWQAGGMPITKMMNMERRGGQYKPVIKKALVELDGKPFQYFAEHREEWAADTCFRYPGAIQYYGPSELCDATTITLALEKEARK